MARMSWIKRRRLSRVSHLHERRRKGVDEFTWVQGESVLALLARSVETDLSLLCFDTESRRSMVEGHLRRSKRARLGRRGKGVGSTAYFESCDL